MNGLLMGVATAGLMFAAFLVGLCLASMSSANKISELEDSTISKDHIRKTLNAASMPPCMQNSTSWNAALLDVKERLGLNDGKRGRIQRDDA